MEPTKIGNLKIEGDVEEIQIEGRLYYARISFKNEDGRYERLRLPITEKQWRTYHELFGYNNKPQSNRRLIVKGSLEFQFKEEDRKVPFKNI